MKTYGVMNNPRLTSALVGGEWSASRSCHFTPAERAPSKHWIGGWMDHGLGVDGLKN
jgi:hypothetical protein